MCVCVSLRVRLLVRLRSCRDWSGLEVKGQINTAGTLLLAGLEKLFLLFFPSLPSPSVFISPSLFYLCQSYFASPLSPLWSFFLRLSLLSFAFATFSAISLLRSLIPSLIPQSSLSSKPFILFFSSVSWLSFAFVCISSHLLSIYFDFHSCQSCPCPCPSVFFCHF